MILTIGSIGRENDRAVKRELLNRKRLSAQGIGSWNVGKWNSACRKQKKHLLYAAIYCLVRSCSFSSNNVVTVTFMSHTLTVLFLGSLWWSRFVVADGLPVLLKNFSVEFRINTVALIEFLQKFCKSIFCTSLDFHIRSVKIVLRTVSCTPLFSWQYVFLL